MVSENPSVILLTNDSNLRERAEPVLVSAGFRFFSLDFDEDVLGLVQGRLIQQASVFILHEDVEVENPGEQLIAAARGLREWGFRGLIVFLSAYPDVVTAAWEEEEERPFTSLGWGTPFEEIITMIHLRRVLIVENHREVLDFLGGLFENELHWEVQKVSRGGEAMEFLESEAFDLLISNIELPGVVSGFTLFDCVRNRRLSTEVLLISSSDYERECVTRGVDGFLQKPLRIADLQTMLSTLFP